MTKQPMFGFGDDNYSPPEKPRTATPCKTKATSSMPSWLDDADDSAVSQYVHALLDREPAPEPSRNCGRKRNRVNGDGSDSGRGFAHQQVPRRATGGRS